MPLTEMPLHNSSFAKATRRVAVRLDPLVLIAEDSPDSREMMQLLLESDGCRVAAADDGSEAIQLALQTLPDLMLIDLELPKLDGLSVVRDLRRRSEFSKVQIFIVSGHDPTTYRQAALDAGCDDYILKPINFDRLHKLVEDVRRRARPN